MLFLTQFLILTYIAPKIIDSLGLETSDMKIRGEAEYLFVW
jgi:hypothetical protein